MLLHHSLGAPNSDVLLWILVYNLAPLRPSKVAPQVAQDSKRTHKLSRAVQDPDAGTSLTSTPGCPRQKVYARLVSGRSS